MAHYNVILRKSYDYFLSKYPCVDWVTFRMGPGTLLGLFLMGLGLLSQDLMMCFPELLNTSPG